MSTEIPEFEVGILSINSFDIRNSFPDEERSILNNLTQEQIMEIAPLAWEKMRSELGDVFWEVFSDSIREATMEVLNLEFDDYYNIVEE